MRLSRAFAPPRPFLPLSAVRLLPSFPPPPSFHVMCIILENDDAVSDPMMATAAGLPVWAWIVIVLLPHSPFPHPFLSLPPSTYPSPLFLSVFFTLTSLLPFLLMHFFFPIGLRCHCGDHCHRCHCCRGEEGSRHWQA